MENQYDSRGGSIRLSWMSDDVEDGQREVEGFQGVLIFMVREE